MVSNKKLNITNVLIFIIGLPPIVLINTITRGNFIAGYFLTIIFSLLLVFQIIMIFISVNSVKGWIKKLTLIFNIGILIFMYWMLHGYIYDLS